VPDALLPITLIVVGVGELVVLLSRSAPASLRNQTSLFLFESEKLYSRFITIDLCSSSLQESSAGRYDCRKAQT
jgi:hypothetical protein